MRSLCLAIFAAAVAVAAAGCDDASRAGATATPLPAHVDGHGIIRGRIEFAGKAPVMKPIITTEACCQNEPPLTEETVVVNPNGTLANTFVFLEGAPQTDGAAQPPALLDQVKCRYVPHALAIQSGQTLNVRSSDPTMHNVHSMPTLNPARNLSMSKAGDQTSMRFMLPEFVPVRCDVHPWMSAWVGVFDNPFHAVTQEQGSFSISGIPAGTYKLVAWHEIYGRQEQTVTVADEKPVETNFTFGRR
jgi:hypothetical protein